MEESYTQGYNRGNTVHVYYKSTMIQLTNMITVLIPLS